LIGIKVDGFLTSSSMPSSSSSSLSSMSPSAASMVAAPAVLLATKSPRSASDRPAMMAFSSEAKTVSASNSAPSSAVATE
jgi:hypothetical protein